MVFFFIYIFCHIFGRTSFVLGKSWWKHTSSLKMLLSNQVFRRYHVSLSPSGYGMLLSNPLNENRGLRKFSGSCSLEVKRSYVGAPVLYLADIGSMIRPQDYIDSRKIHRLTVTWSILCSQGKMEEKEQCHVYSLTRWSAPAVKIQGWVGWNWQSSTPETDTGRLR